jgi:hypothetical protein
VKISKIKRIITAAVAAAMLLAVGVVGASAQLIIPATNRYTDLTEITEWISDHVFGTMEIRDGQGNVVYSESEPKPPAPRVYNTSDGDVRSLMDALSAKDMSVPLKGKSTLLEINDDRCVDGSVYVLKQGEDRSVYAAADGVVAAMKLYDHFGNVILIRHKNGYSFYGNLGDSGGLDLGVGDKVSAGQKIAEVGMTGDVMESQLSFALLEIGDAMVQSVKDGD